MKTCFLKKSFLFVILCFSISFLGCSQETDKEKISFKAASEFKKQAKSLADSHEWLSFKYRNLHYWDDELGWDVIVEVIIKYDDDKSQIFINNENDCFYLLTDNFYKRVDKTKNGINNISKNKKDKNKHYKNMGILGVIPSYFGRVSYFIYPIDYAKTWAVNHIFTGCEKTEIDGKSYNRYKSHCFDDNMISFVNNETNILDSLYSIYQSEDGHVAKDYFSVFDVKYENRQHYIDSIFNFENPEYAAYSRYDEFTIPVMAANTQNLDNEILDFPLVDLNGDTTTLKDHDGWILLNFWALSCGPCLKNLNKYKIEKDSLGYRVLEENGIKILAIEHRSNNMEYIGNVADRMKCRDIIYSAKGFGTKISIPALGYYYLISPKKTIAGKFGELGDYSEVIKCKEEYKKNHPNK